jgi:hypothetical protein
MAKDRLSELERLVALRASGGLSEPEFQREKDRVLSEASDTGRTRELWRGRGAFIAMVMIALLVATAAFVMPRLIDAWFGEEQRQVDPPPTTAIAAPVLPAMQETTSSASSTEHEESKAQHTVSATPIPVSRSVAPVISREWEVYRTRIAEGWGTRPNFASRFVIIRWGCGTGCTFNVVGDHRTGRIYDLGLGGEEMQMLELHYNNGSNSIRAEWQDSETDSCIRQTYRWNGAQLSPVGARRATPRRDAMC